MIFLLWFSSFVWLAVVHWDTQRALQWWFERQQQWLYQEAELVRNGLLQETFVLRRYLEASLQSEVELRQAQPGWIDQVRELDSHLVRLSDDLSPPYLEASLPLAIQEWAKRCDSNAAAAVARKAIALDLPATWYLEPVTRNQMILTSLDYLLTLVRSGEAPVAEVKIQLHADHGWGELVLQVDYPNVTAAVQAVRPRELRYLRRAFQTLALGHSYHRRQQQQVFWHFRWRLAQVQVHP